MMHVMYVFHMPLFIWNDAPVASSIDFHIFIVIKVYVLKWHYWNWGAEM